LVESVPKDKRLFRSSWTVQIDASYGGKRFIVRAHEKLTAFVELEAAIRCEIFGLGDASSNSVALELGMNRSGA
jgi:hypothetical protein